MYGIWILARTYYQSIQKSFEKRQLLTEQMKSSTFSGLCFRCVNQSLQFWHSGLLWECGTAIFDAMIYLMMPNLQPLQLVLRSILVQNTPQPGMIADIQSTAEMAKVAELLKYATIVVSSLPLFDHVSVFPEIFR